MSNRQWTRIREYEDILFDFYHGIARITINRPQRRNAFTPTTVSGMGDALRLCRESGDIRVVALTGAGDKAFCSGGDMNVKGRGGYVGQDGVPRLNVLDVQKQIRSLPEARDRHGQRLCHRRRARAARGARPYHCVVQRPLRPDRPEGPGSFDAGFGSSDLARVVGQEEGPRDMVSLAASTARREHLPWGS